jgi:hypothetical protein
MGQDDGFDPDDPFHVVALIFAGFQCERCYDYFSGVPAGADFGLEMPFGAMGERARTAGWRVEDRGYNDWLVLCPKCQLHSGKVAGELDRP